jgi:hypothetical protein
MTRRREEGIFSTPDIKKDKTETATGNKILTPSTCMQLCLEVYDTRLALFNPKQDFVESRGAHDSEIIHRVEGIATEPGKLV